MCRMLQSDTLKKQAEKAKKKKAALGKDVELEKFKAEKQANMKKWNP